MRELVTRLGWDIERLWAYIDLARLWAWVRGRGDMSDDEVARIVRDGEASEFVRSEIGLAAYLGLCGVTLEEYDRYARRRTIRWVAGCAVVALAFAAWVVFVTWRAGG